MSVSFFVLTPSILYDFPFPVTERVLSIEIIKILRYLYFEDSKMKKFGMVLVFAALASACGSFGLLPEQRGSIQVSLKIPVTGISAGSSAPALSSASRLIFPQSDFIQLTVTQEGQTLLDTVVDLPGQGTATVAVPVFIDNVILDKPVVVTASAQQGVVGDSSVLSQATQTFIPNLVGAAGVVNLLPTDESGGDYLDGGYGIFWSTTLYQGSYFSHTVAIAAGTYTVSMWEDPQLPVLVYYYLQDALTGEPVFQDFVKGTHSFVWPANRNMKVTVFSLDPTALIPQTVMITAQ